MAKIKDEDTGNLVYPLRSGGHLERERSTGKIFYYFDAHWARVHVADSPAELVEVAAAIAADAR
jgi:hypothetical protein